MTCRDVAPLLDAFGDGELDASESARVEAHLDVCPTCAERQQLTRAVARSLSRAVRAEAGASSDFEARLAATLRAERERRREPAPPVVAAEVPLAPRRGRGLLPLLLAAAGVAAVGAVVLARAWVQGGPPAAVAEGPAAAPRIATPEEALEELVRYHAAPPTPQFVEPRLAEQLGSEVGVPVKLPAMNQLGAAWEGGGVVPMRSERAALFRYRLANRPVTVYVYDARRVPLRAVLEPRVVHNQAVHVGERRGYSIAALERRGVGYAVATDMDGDESAEIVTAAY